MEDSIMTDDRYDVIIIGTGAGADARLPLGAVWKADPDSGARRLRSSEKANWDRQVVK